MNIPTIGAIVILEDGRQGIVTYIGKTGYTVTLPNDVTYPITTHHITSSTQPTIMRLLLKPNGKSCVDETELREYFPEFFI